MQVELEKEINKLLNQKIITGKTLLAKFSLLSEYSKKVVAYSDHLHYPFYFYLGRLFKPVNVLEVGFGIGLSSGCFFADCKTPNFFLATQEVLSQSGYDKRIGVSNIRRVYKGNMAVYELPLEEIDEINKIKWDLIIINQDSIFDRHLLWLEMLWKNLREGGLLVQDHIQSHKPSKQSFGSFCQARGLIPSYIRTTYGIGMIGK